MFINVQHVRKFRRLLLTAVVLVLIAALMAACDNDDDAEEESGADAEQGPITIGASLPLSGRFEGPGTGTKQGYEVWAAMVNESGGILGRQVELVIVDNGSDDTVAVDDYEKLITEDQVDLVVGPFSSFLVIPTSAKAAELGYAFVEPAGGAVDVFNRGLDNVFLAQPASSARQADGFALYILGLDADVRPETFAVVSQDDPFATSVMDRLTGLLLDGGLERTFEASYPAEQTDFSEIAELVAEADPDMIIGGTLLEDAIGQIEAYQAADYQPRFAFFTSGPSVPGPFREALGEATEGIFSGISWFPEGTDFQNEEFVTKYVEMFGGSLGDIPEDAANAFTAGQVLQQAIENIQSIDNAALIEELHQGTYQTNVGDLSFDETGAPQGSYMLLQWQGDTFVIVGPPDRAEVDPLDPPKPEW